jgi:hypothetical protein
MSLLQISVLAVLALGETKADLRDAIDAVEEAIDQVKEEGGRCKKAALEDLKDVRDDLKSQLDDTKKRGLTKISKALDGIEDDAGDAECPKKISKLVREAQGIVDEVIEGLEDGGGGGGKDGGGRNPNVPFDDFAPDCKDLWFMHRFHRSTSNDTKGLELIEGLSDVACRSGQPLGEHRWPNGHTAKYANGEWRYPNGQTAKYANGEWRYPNGQTAKYANGEWRYVNGQTAKYANGEWRYPNGQTAGDWQALLAWACGALGKDACDGVNREFDSDIPDWRDYALVEMAYRAGAR